jgi:hypothetical protein
MSGIEGVLDTPENSSLALDRQPRDICFGIPNSLRSRCRQLNREIEFIVDDPWACTKP